MKTYLKRPYEKALAAIYYSSADVFHHLPSRVNFRQRIVQPSTKEQRRLQSSISSSSSSSTRVRHVHWGKYGIKPLGPSDESLCEQLLHGKKSSKVMIILDKYISIVRLIDFDEIFIYHFKEEISRDRVSLRWKRLIRFFLSSWWSTKVSMHQWISNLSSSWSFFYLARRTDYIPNDVILSLTNYNDRMHSARNLSIPSEIDFMIDWSTNRTTRYSNLQHREREREKTITNHWHIHNYRRRVFSFAVIIRKYEPLPHLSLSLSFTFFCPHDRTKKY